jgi:glycosyltransferase involved in cell wall biosynthesis
VHFSKVETFGLVVAEALTRGLKLFAARGGGVVDIAEGVQDAELFEANDFAGLEQRIAQWLEQAVRPAANGAELMRQRYHPLAVARRHLEIYREMIDYRSRSATRSKQ